MFKVTYLRDVIYFDNLEELKKYYDNPEALDLDDLRETIEVEANALDVPVPIIEEI